MCGISGIISAGPTTDLSVEPMNSAMHHRGPDHTGQYVDSHVQLGHNRLAIIDLAEHANQPFSDPSGRYMLVFNGEIYNYLEIRERLADRYEFRTDSDTEVLLAAYLIWGSDCLEQFNGMFAFAIWDRESRKLFAARDRFGVKPFVYAMHEHSFLFASEIKALWAAGVPKMPDEPVWANYFAFGSYGMPHETFWDGIRQLPAGHFLTYAPGDTAPHINRWYHFADRIRDRYSELSEEILTQRYSDLLYDSIALRFRADVPVGFNVSGGLDSSALLAMVNRTREGANIRAFSFYTGDDRYDELPWVRQLLEKTGNPLTPVLVRPEEVPELIRHINRHQDEPYGGLPTLAYAQIFRAARQAGIIVLLDGQGMDEQWAGYDYYQKKTKFVVQGTKRSPLRPEVLSDDLRELARRPAYDRPFDNDLQNTQYRDLFYTKIPRALRFNDRISMAYSTELREPFLDYRLVELAFAQRADLKIRDGQSKYLLRRITAADLGDDLAFAPKRPLQTPQREWLGNELRPVVQESIDTLLHGDYRDWFDPAAVRREWQAYLDGDTDSSFHLWQWMSGADLLPSD